MENSHKPDSTLGYTIEDRHLLFRLGEETYGASLEGIKEIVRPQTYKQIPNTAKFFLGVTNLRGNTVGVVDLRLRFSVQTNTSDKMALIVLDMSNGLIAALVDSVESVKEIPRSSVETSPNINTKIPLEYLCGIAKLEEGLVTIIDLKKMMSTQDLVNLTTMVRGENGA